MFEWIKQSADSVPFLVWVSVTSTPSWVYHCPSFFSYLTGSGVNTWASIVKRSKDAKWKLLSTRNNYQNALFRASGRSREKKSNFAGFSGTNLRKKRPILWEFRGNFQGQFRWKTIGKERLNLWELLEQILLESDWFCADLRKVFNETSQSYSIYSGFIPLYEIVLYKLIEDNKNK